MKKSAILLISFLALRSHAACPEPIKTGFEAYQCILEQNPNMQALRFRDEEMQAISAKAKQIPNPELDAGVEFTGEKKFEVSLLQPFEIGGKRGARIDRARAESSLISAKDLETRIESSNAALESLMRFRQLKLEADFVKSSLSLLERVNRKLKARPALSPEQKTTLRLFATFEKTLRFRETNIENELQKTTAFIEAAIGRPLSASDHIIVESFKKWPSLDVEASNFETTTLKSSFAELEVAKAELKAEQSESWPDFRLGPSVEQDPERSENSWGIKAGITIPLWNLNGAGKDLAKARLNSAQAMYEVTQRQQANQFKSLQKQYAAVTKILAETESVSEIVRSIKESERLFDRSLITPASLIEMYRSTFELVEEVHRNEVQAMVTWLTVENLKGSFPKELP